jgi:LacI family transcriptional regulator
VIAQHPHRLGRAAAQRLFARIDGDRGRTQRVTVPTTLIRRGSGELRP